MELQEVVRRRRMVRHFLPGNVAWETIERIVRTAQHAPSAGYSQGTSFVVVTDAETRRQVAKVAGEPWYVRVGHAPFVSEAPVQVVVCASEETYRERYREPDKRKPGEPEKSWTVPYWHTDAGCALMLLLLAAVDEGLATAFVGVRDLDALRKVLGIPADVTPIGVALIGRGGADMQTRSAQRGRRPLGAVLHRERW